MDWSALERVNRDLLIVLVTILETRESYTAGHSLAVARLSRLMAEWLGLPEEVQGTIHTAGLLHDIGKHDVLIASLVQKPGALSYEEVALMKQHPVAGADFLERVGSLHASVIEAVRHHHEHFDGSGYPDGLMGEDIPLSSRIIRVCDTIDAMGSDRAYRPALPGSKIRKELEQQVGKQFDPLLVALVLDRMKEFFDGEGEA